MTKQSMVVFYIVIMTMCILNILFY